MAVQNQKLQQQEPQTTVAREKTSTAITKATAVSSIDSPTKEAMFQQQQEQQANGGPRVSFNRDVHVKRIGKRPNDITNYETTNLQPPQNSILYHQLPAELSAEDIRKEAALVLAQAERHKSKARNGDNIPTFKVRTKRSGDPNPKKFHSLPSRKKKSPAKPVTRSVSDAAAKKPTKRPSIFSIFSRKSDTNINQVERDPRFEDSGGRRLIRSKSDVGSYNKEDRKLKKNLKEPKLALNGSTKQVSTPLSPIIENSQKEDYFADQFNRERRKSDAITDREKHESGVTELLERSRLKAEVDGILIGRNGVSNHIKEKILTLQTKSNENMHSSQLPAQKLPLTKGVTVNGLVKRLSMERFSPPPPISGTAFSYIRPNDGITYAQLDLSDDQQNSGTLWKRDRCAMNRESNTPMREYRSPTRDISNIPDRKIDSSGTFKRTLNRSDFVTSHNNLKNTPTNYSPVNLSNSRFGIDSTTTGVRDSFSPTTIRISNSHSPSPWHQLSPRNLSDEDEGLGIETRKYYHEDESSKVYNKPNAEPPIIPVIRNRTPTRENGYEVQTNHEERFDDLDYRRARLESRILMRRLGDTETLPRNDYHKKSASPEIIHNIQDLPAAQQHYISAQRRSYEPPLHGPQTAGNTRKYSPESSHIDIISPASNNTSKIEKTSQYRHTKYYDDGRGGIKEVYQRESHLDADGKPYVHESRHRERLNSQTEKHYDNSSPDRQQLTDYEPKSLDSQFTSIDQYRSSPENMKRYELSVERGLNRYNNADTDERWQSSLKRDKLQQRSFDKGDSGIENDFRKESFNGENTTRWRKRTIADEMKACEYFINKERRFSEQQLKPSSKDNFIIYRDNIRYRERSIDDGSHFDPHLDKYPVTTSNLRRRDQQSQTGQDTLKRTKKLGGFEKVKQLFSGGGSGLGGSSSSTSTTNAKKEMNGHLRTHSTTSGSGLTTNDKKDKYMVKEEEMRSRYSEHRGTNLQDDIVRDPKTTDISMRRRLSTPKASPLLLKRTSSDKVKKESSLAKPEKTSWFKSLDRRAKSKSKEKLNISVNGQNEATTIKRSKNIRNTVAPPIPPKNLRFFGDTDLDSNPPTISRAHTTLKTRPTLSSTLNRSQKYSQSDYNLDRINTGNNVPKTNTIDYRHHASTSALHIPNSTRQKSSSMHNLENDGSDEVDFRKRRHYSRSRDLDDISESGSETEDQNKRANGIISNSHRYDDHTYRSSNDSQVPLTKSFSTPKGADTNNGTHIRRTMAHNLMGPPKPARSAERRMMSSYTRDRDHFPAESSGTEGESSLHSQRSIVYLHATTVGAIPQPYHLRRRALSRDDLRSNKSKNPPLQPMTRTVSRSVSMLAPWKPKLISEGYEINYSQEQNKRTANIPRKQYLKGSSSTLTRGSKKSETPSSRSTLTRRHEHNNDDESSVRNSSITSASKSALSYNLRGDSRRKLK